MEFYIVVINYIWDNKGQFINNVKLGLARTLYVRVKNIGGIATDMTSFIICNLGQTEE